MSLCRGCGASIEWIRTTAGRSMPVDPEPVFVVEEDGGRERFITDEGEVVAGGGPCQRRRARRAPWALCLTGKRARRQDRFRRR